MLTIRNYKSLCFILISLLVAGCSARPIPQDVTKERTYEIVQKIRCEVRDALRSYLLGALVKFRHEEIANRLRADPSLYKTFDRRVRAGLHPTLQQILERHDHGAIGYEFTFDMSEENAVEAGLSLGRLLERGPFSISAGTKSDKKRTNKRNFVIIDNFETLVRHLDLDNENRPICNVDPKSPNLAYPIAGSLGLDEFVGTYFNLYEFGSLATKKDTPSIFSDSMDFTTTISADFKGGIKLSPISGRGARPTDAEVKYDTSRTDKHSLVISLVLAQEVTKKGKPITASEQNAEARSLARLELERQRLIKLDVENSLFRRNVLSLIPERQ